MNVPSSKQRGYFSAYLVLLVIPLVSPINAQALSDSVSFYSVKPDPDFADAVEKGAIQSVCAESKSELHQFFDWVRTPLEEKLIFNLNGKHCHIWYEPSLPGFRALPENQPISGLYFDLHTVSVMANRNLKVGDTLDIVKSILASINVDLPVSIGIAYMDSQGYEWAKKGVSFHFPNRPVSLRNNGNFRSTIWAQDYVKSGSFGKQPTLIIPRNLYEGQAKYQSENSSLLNSVPVEQSFRSKLSWEGGDLILVDHPTEQGSRILFYGWASRLYWGRNLTQPEYEYVLKREFGADLAIDISDPVSHIDYLVTFVPKHNLVLVATPVRGDRNLAFDALRMIREVLGPSEEETINEVSLILEQFFEQPSSDLERKLVNLIQQFQKKLTAISKKKPSSPLNLPSLESEDCLESFTKCLNDPPFNTFLEKKFSTVTDWVTRNIEFELQQRLPQVLIEIVESQIRSDRRLQSQRSIQVTETLAKLGFKVLSIPRIGGDPEAQTLWPGISYANSLLVEDQLFVPTFGLGPSEQSQIENLSQQLTGLVTVIPVYSRYNLVFNGGIHCVTGIIRSP
jgi:hypothetical protein